MSNDLKRYPYVFTPDHSGFRRGVVVGFALGLGTAFIVLYFGAVSS